MKKISLLFFVAFSFFGCESTPVSESKAQSDYVELYNKIVKLEDTNEQLQAASALNSNQMLGLWKLKLKNFKTENSLNKAQLQFINNFETILQVDLFINESIIREDFIKNKYSFLLNEAKKLFGENEGYYLLTHVENINQRIDMLNKNASILKSPKLTVKEGPIKACECNVDGECIRLTSIGIDGLGWEYGYCGTRTDCYDASWFVWTEKTGRCIY